MFKTYLLLVAFIGAFLVFSCSSDDEINDSENVQNSILIKKLELGINNSKQLNYNSDFPINFSLQFDNNSDKVNSVTIELIGEEGMVYQKNYTDGNLTFDYSILLSNEEYSLKNNSLYTLTIEVNTDKGVKKKIESKVRFIDFYISKPEVHNDIKMEVNQDQWVINSDRNKFKFQDIHYVGNLKEVRLLIVNKEDSSKSFYYDPNIDKFKNDEENFMYINIYKDLCI